MLYTTNPIIKHKIGLLNLTEEFSNISKTCKIMSVSRDMFYHYLEPADKGRVNSLINYSHRAANLKHGTDDATGYAMINYSH